MKVSHMRLFLASTSIVFLAGNAAATETTCYGHAAGLQLTGKARDDAIAKCKERTLLQCELNAKGLTGDERHRSIKFCMEVYVGKPTSN